MKKNAIDRFRTFAPGFCAGLFFAFLPSIWTDLLSPGWKSLRTSSTLAYRDWKSSDSEYIFPLYSCDWATVGNLVSGLNNVSDDWMMNFADFGFEVKEVAYDGQTYRMGERAGAMVFETNFGEFTIFKSGFFTYTSTQGHPQDEHDETIQVLLANVSGYEVERIVTVDTIRVERTENNFADYQNQISGPNYVEGGVSFYRTPMINMAMVFGWKTSDQLFGGAGNNAIFAWSGGDVLHGSGLSDFLAGEQGHNILVGAGGADYFSIRSGHVSSDDFDTIRDFNPGEGDVIGLADMVDANFGPLNAAQYVKFVRSDTHVDLNIDFDGSGEEYTWGHVARLETHSNFTSTQYSLFELIQNRFIVFGVAMPEVTRNAEVVLN